jgi:hypothetical protein
MAHGADGIGKAIRCSNGKSVCTLSHCAWKPAKRSVMAWKVWRTASRWSGPLQGHVGAVLAIEASRLARNGRDWHTLIEFCGLVGSRSRCAR